MRMVQHTSDPTMNPQEDVVNEVTGPTACTYMMHFINNGVIHVFTLNYHGETNENGHWSYTPRTSPWTPRRTLPFHILENRLFYAVVRVRPGAVFRPYLLQKKRYHKKM